MYILVKACIEKLAFSDEEANALIKAGYVKRAEEPKEQIDTRDEPAGDKGTPSEAKRDLASLTVKELVKLAKAAGVQGCGKMKKEELLEALK